MDGKFWTTKSPEKAEEVRGVRKSALTEREIGKQDMGGKR